MARGARTTTVRAVVGLLLLTSCGGPDAPRAGTPEASEQSEESERGVVVRGPDGPSSAPGVDTDAPAGRAWTLAQLEPPPGAEVVSSVQQPHFSDLDAFLVVATTTPEAAAAVCAQMGGLLPLSGAPLSERQRSTFDLAEDPVGELGLCGGATNGEQLVVQRDVLVAEAGGRATVWLAVFEMPR